MSVEKPLRIANLSAASAAILRARCWLVAVEKNGELEMSDRGLLVVFSLCVIVGCLLMAVWLAVAGQAAYIDGLFLMLSCLVLALAFGLYARYVTGSVTADVPVTATSKIKAGGEKLAPPAAVRASEQVSANIR